MADRDDTFPRSDDDDRFSRSTGPYADDAAFDPYYRKNDRAGDARDVRRDILEPIDPDYPGYTEYGRDHDQEDAYPATPDDHDPGDEPPKRSWRYGKKWPIFKWALRIFLAFTIVLVGWLAIAAPVSRTERPLVPPPIVLTTSDGTAIARMGPIMGRPVAMDELPDHVAQAFMAIEDRRFEDHWGIDPYGIARALWTNATSDTRQGGSTITQQLAKLTYLSSDQTLFRKAQEVPIAIWLEAWLTKEQILERYLSNVYFGDNVYGLRAASLHYFYRHPENLTLSQAAMLAGLVKAPSRLAPTSNIEGAQERERVVLAAMVEAGYLTAEEAAAVPLATVDHRPDENMPRSSYFAEWAIEEARASQDGGYDTIEVATTLDRELQTLAERVTRQNAPAGAQVALVAMRPNGEIVAMVGGRNFSESSFNRATQAMRQPGSTFKLVVYLAALQSGMTPNSMVEDVPIETGAYQPSNAGGRYRGTITLREAFARSSNVVAVRLYRQLGSEAIADAARDLGLSREFPANASVALGSAGMPLIELVSAYATVANGTTAVPHAIPQGEQGFFDWLTDDRSTLSRRTRDQLLDLLGAAITDGTGGAARLTIPAYGKTGTSQDSRDAVFVGFAGDLVVGVWIGNDDNSPLGNASGGGAPARIWRNFMTGAIPDAAPRPRPRAAPPPPPDEPMDQEKPPVLVDENGITIDTDIGGGRITIGPDGEPGFDPDGETRRRMDELERIGEDAQRAVEEATQ